MKAAKLNQALGEYGSKGGIIPYDENGQGDTSHELPLGTKQNPFGNAFFKGMNIYTVSEVQQLVSDGKLTQTDRFVFWNLTTNTLCAWNGTEIVTLQGSEDSMKYLFGDGSDGDVTMVADGSYDVMKNFTNFTINSGVTLTKGTAGSPLVIRCTGTCTINGKINVSGKGFSGSSGPSTASGYGVSGTSEFTLPGVSAAARYASGSCDINLIQMLAAVFDFGNIPWCGGGGSGSNQTRVYSSDSGWHVSGVTTRGTPGIGAGTGGAGGGWYSTASGMGNGNVNSVGGAGGGGVLIIANKIILPGEINANGANGGVGQTNDYFAACGGGGGGGTIVLLAKESIGVTGNIYYSGGAGGGGDAAAGGNGCFVKLIV